MVFRSGRRIILAPLLILLALVESAAAPVPAEQAYRAARSASDRGDNQLALQRANEALSRLGNAADEWTWALRILKGELLIKSRTGVEQGKAIVEPELPPRLRTSEAAVRRLIALGILRPDKSTFEAALDLATKHQPRLVADAHIALANVVPIAEAEKHLRAATELARRSGNRLTVALAQNVLSYRYSGEQRYAEAVDAGDKALAAFESLRVVGRLSSACGNLGWAYYELGDYETAADLFTRAEAAAAKAGNETHRVMWLNNLGNIHFAHRQWQQAEKEYRAALDRGRRINDPTVPVTLTNLARVSVELGRFDDARALNGEALRIKRAARDEEEIARSLIVDARIDMLTGNGARAEKTLLAVTSDDPKTRWETDARLGELYARMQRKRDAETRFAHAIETVRTARAAVKGPELKLAFFNAVEDLFDLYVDFLMRNQRVEDALAVTEVSRAQTLEEGLQIRQSPRALDARAIAKLHDTTILCYWLGRDRSYVWTVTPATVTAAALPADSVIEAAADAYRRDVLTPGPRGGLEVSGRRGAELYRMIVVPALKAIAKDASVTVIADGDLHALSFDTLVVPSPRPHYWIEDVVLSSASSLQLLARAPQKRASAPAMLLVGNPPQADPAYPPLRYAGAEMQSVARHFAKRVVLEGAKATPAGYEQAKPGTYDYLHFVAHGVATRKHPLDSAVILGRDAASGYKLFARDIVQEPLHARLVTISSCHGAGTRTFAGEGLVGLAWAFLRAGAEQVVAALWEVNDSATPKIMDRMYASIRAGRDPALALRDAKLELVRSNTVFRYPRYWAPFVLYSGS